MNIAQMAPSTFAETTEWMRFQGLSLEENNDPFFKFNFPIMCYRPCLSRGIPVELLEPIFGDLIDAKTTIDANDCDFTLKMCSYMSMPYRKEEERMIIFRRLFSDYLGKTVEKANIGHGFTDGSITVRKGNITLMVLNVEGKAEIGQGRGDPTFQNIGYYLTCLLGSSNSTATLEQQNFVAGYKCPGIVSSINFAHIFLLMYRISYRLFVFH